MPSDDLARRLLAAEQMGEQPGDKVRGTAIVRPAWEDLCPMRGTITIARGGLWSTPGGALSRTPADWARLGWSLDLTSDATGGVLFGLLVAEVGLPAALSRVEAAWSMPGAPAEWPPAVARALAVVWGVAGG